MERSEIVQRSLRESQGGSVAALTMRRQLAVDVPESRSAGATLTAHHESLTHSRVCMINDHTIRTTTCRHEAEYDVHASLQHNTTCDGVVREQHGSRRCRQCTWERRTRPRQEHFRRLQRFYSLM